LGNRSKLDGPAVDDDFSGRRRFHARHNPHERAFARAVFADDCEYFASSERQRNIVERSNTRELLAYMSHF
jgi:hypothetical protein